MAPLYLQRSRNSWGKVIERCRSLLGMAANMHCRAKRAQGVRR
jgi:hypothetical protein